MSNRYCTTTPESKRCSVCGETKPLSEFYVRTRRGRTGPEYNCKACSRAASSRSLKSDAGRKRLARYRAEGRLRSAWLRYKQSLKTKVRVPPASGKKVCSSCKQEKPVREFYRSTTGTDGYLGRCKSCVGVTQRKYRASAIATARRHRHKTLFGDPNIYAKLVAVQGEVCAICGAAPKAGRSLHVDHDHKTGAIRGLLCAQCNQAIGLMGDNAARLHAAAEYLARRKAGAA